MVETGFREGLLSWKCQSSAWLSKVWVRSSKGGTTCGLSDSHLLDRYLSRRHDGGGEAAFAAIVKRHGPMVHRVCRGVLGQWHDADDAYQATFLILARKASSIRSGGSVGSWLYGVARRVAIRARDERNRRTERERSARMRIEADRAHWEQPELMPEVQEEIDRLPEKYRATVVLCDLEGLTHDEAASALRVPVGTVKIRLFRGRERLRKRFARRGLAPELLAIAGQAPQPSSSTSPLTDSTIQAAMRIAEGKAAGVSASVAALVQGALRAMFLTRLKSLVLLLVLSVLVLLSATLSRSEGPRDPGSQKAGDRAAPKNIGAVSGEEERLTETLRRSDFLRTISDQVTLEPISQVDVFSSVPGRLKSISVDVGDHVTPGQVLAEIEAPELLLDLEEAEAIVEREQARVSWASLRRSRQGLPTSNAGARASAEEANADFGMAKAELKVAEARLHRAKARVSSTRIVSPIKAVVTRRAGHPGELIRGQDGLSSAILTIADTSRMKAKLFVPGWDLPLLDRGDPATLRPTTASDDVFTGKVARIEVVQQAVKDSVGP